MVCIGNIMFLYRGGGEGVALEFILSKYICDGLNSLFINVEDEITLDLINIRGKMLRCAQNV